MTDLWADLRAAARALRRRPRFLVAAGAVLALGMGIAIAALSVARAYLSRPLPFPNADRLAWILTGPSRDAQFPVPDGFGEVDWSAAAAGFERLVAWDLDGFTLTGEPAAAYVDGAWVSASFFPTVGGAPAAGRFFTAAEAREGAPVAVISHGLWQRRFGGDPGVVGRRIELFSTDRPQEARVVTVVGVLPPAFWYLNRFTDVLLPLHGPRAPTLALLPDGVSRAEAERRLNAAVLPQLRSVPEGWRLSLVGAQDEHVFRARPVILLLLGAATVMLLVATANAAGLMLARGAERSREMAIRAALGAGRTRMLRQLLAEGALLAGAAAVAGAGVALLLLSFGAPMLERQLGVTVPGGLGRLRPDALVLALAGLAAAVTGVAAALRPALAAARGAPGQALRSGGRVGTGPEAARTRGWLVAGEIAVACVLVVGAALMTRTLAQLRQVDVGFDADLTKAEFLLPLAHYPTPADRAAVMDRVLAALSAEPGVTDAAVVFPYPFRPAAVREVGTPGGATARAALRVATPGYFATARVPLLAGRGFTAADGPAAEPVAVISADFARRGWPAGDAVGGLLDLDPSDAADRPVRVVGVAGDIRETLVDPPVPDVYLPYAQQPGRFVAVLLRGPGLADADRVLREATRRVDAALAPADVENLGVIVDRERRARRLLARALASVALAVLVIGAAGLYATLGYLVHQRQREFAVRLAVGARATELVGLVLRDGAVLGAWGLGVGLVGSLALTRLLGSQLYGVSPFDPLAFAAALTALSATVGLALLLPARRAAHTNPMETLRHD